MEPLSTRFTWNQGPEGSAAPSYNSTQIQERRLRQVMEIIDSEPSSSIRDLAQKVSLSSAHLQRLFKQQTGQHLGSLLVERRLQKAAQLLTVSNLSIKEIAHAVGYRHHSSFVRAFQRRFAQAPKHYRYQPAAAATHA
jgi:transcriptional regulator GlxA family with amidase domain